MEGYFQVGYVRKKHGFKGDVVVRITADDPTPYQGLDAYFVEDRGKALPFFVATQFHPEFHSRPNKPHPLFLGFVKAAIQYHDAKQGERGSEPLPLDSNSPLEVG